VRWATAATETTGCTGVNRIGSEGVANVKVCCVTTRALA
jgi:hypothetical protein